MAVSQPSNATGSPHLALVALGSNVTSTHGGPGETLNRALAALAGDDIEIVARSRFFETPCFPAGSGPDFVNAAIAVQTSLGPGALLSRLHNVESAFGRERAERWGARILDLDLIAFGQAVLPDAATVRAWIDLPPRVQRQRAPDTLILPHPRLQDRGFVLIPLADIAPDWRHPILGRTVREMEKALPAAEKTAIRPLTGPHGAGKSLVNKKNSA